MAITIPDRLPARATRGEELVFDVLKQLPDDCIVYYEPIISDRYPDFVVIMPSVGVLIVEVKGWRNGEIRGYDGNCVSIGPAVAPMDHDHPSRQARRYMLDLMDTARRHRAAGCLLNQGGEHKGAFSFPFCHFVVLTQIADALDRSRWRDVFPDHRTVYASQLHDLAALSPEGLLAAIKQRCVPWWDFVPLDVQQIDVLRTVIHPEATIAPHDDELDRMYLAALDIQQEGWARRLGDGHRILRGVAGSGKTLILVARARLLSRAGKRVLLLCFNRNLAQWLAGRLQDATVEVRTFHGWGSKLGVRLPQEDRFLESQAELGEMLLGRLLDLPKEDRFDAVLVDEGQDFHPTWFKCAKEALREPEIGDLVIAIDAAQSIYGLRNWTWQALGIKAQSRTITKKYDLHRNYRNTREILEVAAPFAALNCGSFTEAQPEGDEDNADFRVRIDPSLTVRNGPIPTLVEYPSIEDEIVGVVAVIRDMLTSGRYSANEIAILYPRLPNDRKAALTKLVNGIKPFAANYVLGRPSHDGEPAKGCIRIGNIYQFKGLQAPSVLIMWADLLPRKNVAEDCALMYVGLTRAEHELRISCSRSSPFVEILRPACKRRAWSGE